MTHLDLNEDGATRFEQSGMSLLDYFAAMALQGYRASLAGEARTEPLQPGEKPFRVGTSATVAAWAYADADAMLAERNKR